MTVARARNLFATWRSDEYGYIKRRILRFAYEHGTVHADDVSQDEYASRNIIGAAFNALRAQRLIVSTGEHRKSRMPSAHGRKSYVYRLTAEGLTFARVMEVDREAMFAGRPAPVDVYVQQELDV